MFQTLAIIVIAMTTAFSLACAGHIYLFDGPNLYGNYVDWAFSKAQHCYSVPCFNDRTQSIKFSKLPESCHLVVYEDTGCQGKHYKIAATPNGKSNDKDGEFDFGISSFMVWSWGTYATSGMTNICEDHDKERLDANLTVADNTL